MEINRKIHPRKSIRVVCSLEMMNGTLFQGYTRNISSDRIFIGSYNVVSQNRSGATPGVGDTGLIRLRYKHGDISDSLVTRCRLTHVTPDGIGLYANFSDLPEKKYSIFDKIMNTNSSSIVL